MPDNIKCEKCGGSNILVGKDCMLLTRGDPFRGPSEVTIGGARAIVYICLDCGKVMFYVDHESMKKSIKSRQDQERATRELEELEEQKTRDYVEALENEARENKRIKNDFDELKSKYSSLLSIQKKEWEESHNIEISKIKEQLEENQRKVTSTKSKMNLLIEEQQKKQATLKELGLNPVDNPEIVQKLVSEYESLKRELQSFESEKQTLLSSLQKVQSSHFNVVETEDLKNIKKQISELEPKVRALTQSFSSHFR